MKTVADLIDAARKALGVTSDAEFARKLGVSRGTIANWKSGYSLPDTVMCATLAGLTGEPLAKVLGIVGEARAVSREEKAVWRKLAATAALLAVGVLGGALQPAQAATRGFSQLPDCALCENLVLLPVLRRSPRLEPSVRNRAFVRWYIECCFLNRKRPLLNVLTDEDGWLGACCALLIVWT